MADESAPRPRNGGSRPVPDPTVLTTELITRAIQAERERVDGKLETLQERLRGIDEATKLRLIGIVDIPNMIDEKVGHLRTLHDERFHSIATQFLERDTRSERESRDNKVAVDAAFAAQKEAAAKQDEGNNKNIDKAQAATQETINKLAELFRTTTDAITDKVDDLKERVGRIEAIKQGGSEARSGLSTNLGIVATVVVVGIAIVTFIATH